MSAATQHHISAANQQLTLEDISRHVRTHIGEWLAEKSLAKPLAAYEIELRERMIRLEEELKNQRELMKQGFDLMEKRFESMDKRFESMDKRFESMDKRFGAISAENNRRFEAISAESSRRFEAMSVENNKRFEDLSKRIDRLMVWSLGITMGTGSLVVAALKLLL